MARNVKEAQAEQKRAKEARNVPQAPLRNRLEALANRFEDRGRSHRKIADDAFFGDKLARVEYARGSGRTSCVASEVCPVEHDAQADVYFTVARDIRREVRA
jgi:hypothetical protein